MIEAVRFPVAGMTCSSCVNRITRALRKVDGVTKVKVDLGRETATVWREADVPDSALAAAVSAAGYAADLGASLSVTGELSQGTLARILHRS